MSSDELDNILSEIKGMKDDSRSEFTLSGESETEAPAQSSAELSLEEAEAPIPEILDSFNSAGKKATKENSKMPDKKGGEKMPQKKKYTIFAAVAIAAIVIIAVIVMVAVKAANKPEPTTAAAPTTVATTTAAVTEASLPTENPLTGSSDFREKAVGKRPIACVVENSQAARPQWGINDSKNPPDIILEGEVEGGETRMLWFYADYKAVPSQIGPMRSARPSFVKFSESFDAIFIHWGMSKTKRGTNYVGANTVFKQDKVDHINQMTYSGNVALFGRDSSRGGAVEHTGVLYGNKIADAIKDVGFRKKAKQEKYTKFSFTDEAKYEGSGKSLALTFSSRTHTRDWSYSESDKMYHSNDYQTDVARKNLIVLFDDTEYVSKPGYKGQYTEVYLNYLFKGGKGKVLSNGTSQDVTWKIENGLVSIKDKDGKPVELSVGTTWIGWASSNNGGKMSVQ